jgi:monoamine oxidase
VAVVEARIRLGGRCQTGEYSGEFFDLGGHWIGGHQPRIRQLIDEIGLETKKQYDSGTHMLCLLQKMHNYAGNISSLNSFGEILSELEGHVKTWDKEMMLFDPCNPEKSESAKQFDRITLAEWQTQNMKSEEAKNLMTLLMTSIFTVQPSQISYLWWLYYLRGGHGYSVLTDIQNGAQQSKIVGGCEQILSHIAKQIGSQNIFLRSPVTKITQTSSSVVISTQNGKTFNCKYVIVTAPPAVCHHIHFEPALPSGLSQLHQTFKMGTVIKFYVIYSHRWWLTKGLSGEMLSDEDPLTFTYDATTEKVPALIAFCCADNARKWMGRPFDEMKKAVVDQLVKIYGDEAAKPEQVLVRPWTEEDVWAGGGYAGSLPVNSLSLYRHMREHHGRVYFASTELALDWCGYFEGAVEAGQRAASEVLTLLLPPSRL